MPKPRACGTLITAGSGFGEQVSPADIYSCEFRGNEANYGGALYPGAFGGVRCHSSTFTNNRAGFDGGAVYNSGRFVDCLFDSNSVFWDGGGAVRGGGQFVNCTFVRNIARLEGGGAVFVLTPTSFANCVFAGNSTTNFGGAVRVNTNTSASLVNCLLMHNSSVNGSGALTSSGACTVANSLIWSNGVSPVQGVSVISYSCGDHGIAGAGNIVGDPLFMDPLGPDGAPGTLDEDYRLRSDSPCIDAGDTLALPRDEFDLDRDGDASELLPIDLAGNARFVNCPGVTNTGLPVGPHPVVDMGAFEFDDFRAVPGDITADGLVGVRDLLATIIHWGECAQPCGPDIAPEDGDGIVDALDLLEVIFHWSVPTNPA